MLFLRQSTASQEILLGRFVDSADGNTEETGLTIANTDIKLWKEGATTLADKNSGGATHIANGNYYAVLDATDTDTVGKLEVHVHVSGALAVKREFMVLEEAVYDAFFAASATGYVANAPVNVAQFGGVNGTFSAGRPEVNVTHAAGTAWNSGAITSGTLANDAITDAKVAADVTIASVTGNVGGNVVGSVGSVATGGITAASFAAGAIDAAAIAANAIDADAIASDAITEIQSGLATAANLATVAGYVDTEIASILTLLSTTGIVVNDFTAAAKALLQVEANDALVANNLDHLVLSAVDTNFATTVHVDSVIGQLAQTADGGFDRSSESLEAIRERGDSAWTTGGGGSLTDVLNIVPLIPQAVDLADTSTWRLALALTNGVDDLPSTAEITPGTISIDRKAIGDTTWSAVITDQACSEAAGLIYYDAAFTAGAGFAAGDSLRITFKSQKITVSANDYEISDATGRIFYSWIREAERGLDATGTRSAVGLASANLDTQLAALAAFVDTEVAAALAAILDVKAKTDNLPASPAAVGSAMTLESGERDAIAAASLDLTNGVETSLTVRQAMRVFHAVLAGEMTTSIVGSTVTINFRDKADSKNRVVVTFDSSTQQRTAVTFDLS